MTSFWSMWIIILTSITIVGITWILFANRKREEQPADKTTGHEYDGIQEYDNPLPAWWFYMFVLTIVWGVGYLIIYPGMGNFPGVLGWTQIAARRCGRRSGREIPRHARSLCGAADRGNSLGPGRAENGYAHVW